MSDTAWKSFERRIASHFPGAYRRGAYTSDGHGGKSDIVCPGWSIECKLYTRLGFQDLLNAALQAEANRESPQDIPIAVCKRKGDHDINSLVVMRLEQFSDFFINAKTQDGQRNADPD